MCVIPCLSRCLLGVLVSAFRCLCVPVPVCPCRLVVKFEKSKATKRAHRVTAYARASPRGSRDNLRCLRVGAGGPLLADRDELDDGHQFGHRSESNIQIYLWCCYRTPRLHARSVQFARAA